MTTTPVTGAAPTSYICRFCRLPSEASGLSCPNCGAPVDVRAAVSDSGWVEQPAVRDMARIQFGQSYCQIEGTLVPTADFALAGNDGVIFSHHTLLWVQPGTHLEAWSQGSFFNRTLCRDAAGAHAGERARPCGSVGGPPGRGRRVADPGRAGFPRAGARLPGRERQRRLHVAERACLAADQERRRHRVRVPGRFLTSTSSLPARSRPGLLLLHCPGNLFVRDLAPGQAILVQPGSWVYSDTSVSFGLHAEYPASRRHGVGQLRLPDGLDAPRGPGQGGGALHIRETGTLLGRGPQQRHEPAALVGAGSPRPTDRPAVQGWVGLRQRVSRSGRGISAAAPRNGRRPQWLLVGPRGSKCGRRSCPARCAWRSGTPLRPGTSARLSRWR